MGNLTDIGRIGSCNLGILKKKAGRDIFFLNEALYKILAKK
jgi:hypothetical protein